VGEQTTGSPTNPLRIDPALFSKEDHKMTERPVHPFEPSGRRRELIRLVRRVQELTLELEENRQNGDATPEFQTAERTLEQLRWRLATVARRDAIDDLGAAA
jgi:hypothetical protein